MMNYQAPTGAVLGEDAVMRRCDTSSDETNQMVVSNIFHLDL